MIDFVDVVRVESGRFATAIEGAPLNDPVPPCPGWSIADLIWHLTEVQDFWGKVVAGGIRDPEEVVRRKRPTESELLETFRVCSRQLIEALRTHDSDEAVWTWASDRSVAFVRRRQAHEALIHRVDAEVAAGLPITPINPDLAGDGIDEMLNVMLGGIPEWGAFTADGRHLRIDAVDSGVSGTSWVAALGRFTGTSPSSGTTYDLDAAIIGTAPDDPDAVISGRAADLDLWLWGRGSLAELTVVGDRGQVDRLRRMAAESTQ
jgi:uncharacterized protein (TIGR03083 family)